MENAKQFRRLILQDIALIFLLVIGTIIAINLGVPTFVVLPACVTLVFFLLLFMAMYVLNNSRVQKTLSEIRAAQPQVEWHYTSDQWHNFITSPQVQADLAAHAQVWQPSLLRNAIVMSSVVFFLFALVNYRQGVAGLVSPTIVGIGVFALLVRSARRVQRSLRHPYGQSEQPPTVIISSVGAILGRQSLRFKQPRSSIRKVDIPSTEPRRLYIQIEYAINKERKLPYTLTIPIPKSQEAEAEMIRYAIPRTIVA